MIKAQVVNQGKIPAEETEMGNASPEDWELEYHCLLALMKKKGFVTEDSFSKDDQKSDHASRRSLFGTFFSVLFVDKITISLVGWDIYDD